MSNEQLSAADALRFGAQVIELYDDATMKDDHMIDSGECASVLLALAEYLQRGAILPAASEAGAVAWAIRYAVSADLNQVDYHGHNALADYKATYPDATASPLYAAPVIRYSRIAGDGEAGAVQVSDEALIAHWILAGGAFPGPNVETGSMPQDKLLPFLRRLLAAPPEKQASHSEGDAGGVRVPIELANRVDDALGRFTSDEGWGQADMDTADDFSALLAAPTVSHSLTVAQGDELRAALVRIRKHIGQHEIHGALKEVDAALARLSGERSHGDERATLARLEAACAALCKMRTQDQYLSMIDAGQQDALLELDSARAAARAALARQQGGGDAEDAARYRCIRNGPHSERYGDLYAMAFQGDGDVPLKGAELDAAADSAIKSYRAQRATAQGANDADQA